MVKTNLLNLVNDTFKLSILLDSLNVEEIESKHFENYLNNKYSVLDIVLDPDSELSTEELNIVSFLIKSNLYKLDVDEGYFKKYTNSSADISTGDLVQYLDELIKHKLKGKDDYKINGSISSVVDKNILFNNKFSKLIVHLAVQKDALLEELYNIIRDKSVLLSDHPSHFIISKNKKSKLPSVDELKELVFDYQLTPNIYSDELTKVINNFKQHLGGSGIVPTIIEIRENSLSNDKTLPLKI